MKYIDIYFKDGTEVSCEEWYAMINEDIEKVQEQHSAFWVSAVHSDLSNGRDVQINGHNYQQRTNILYDSAKELFEDLMFDGHYDVIVDVLKEMTEEEIFNVLSKSKCISAKENKQLLLIDEKDWE